MMIITSIIIIAIGAFAYYQGNSMNNDFGAQLESFFSNGTTNPGSLFEIIGVILMVIGLILFVVSVVLTMENKEESVVIIEKKPEIDTNITTPKVPQETCKYCGATIAKDSKFCAECGKNLKEKEELIICPYCGEKISKGSKFCMYCGEDIPTCINT